MRQQLKCVRVTQGMALALSLVALAAWLLWDWVQHRLRARERELANTLTQDLDVDSIKRLVGEVRRAQHGGPDTRHRCGLRWRYTAAQGAWFLQ